MPAVLREHQFELLDVDDTFSFVFGTEDTGFLTTTYPTITAADARELAGLAAELVAPPVGADDVVACPMLIRITLG